MKRAWFLLSRLALASSAAFLLARSVGGSELDELPLVFSDRFENGMVNWTPTDPAAWAVVEVDGTHVLSLQKQSDYQPPHRSPVNFALLEEVPVEDFELTAKVRSTVKDYDHRDMCLIFGYQDAAHFYYVHFGKRADDHANQIFIVDGAPRTKISTKTSEGTPWDDAWHNVKLVRGVATGTIEVYFDDLSQPVMTAQDTTFGAGTIGLGSFDDTGDWDDVELHAKAVKKP